MSTVVTRSPLQIIGMNGAGTQKRRSARLSGDSVEENEPPAKKSRINGATTTTTLSTKDLDGDTNVMSKRKPRKAYETEIDGFSFTKAKGKKAKDAKQASDRNRTTGREDLPVAVEQAAVPTATCSERPAQEDRSHSAAPAETPVPKSTRKNVRRLPASPDGKEARKAVRRSHRASHEAEPDTRLTPSRATPQPSPQRAAHAKSHANTARSPSPDGFRPVTIEKKRKRGADGREEERKTMRINLPSWDTPMMKKNKDLRKSSGEGSRRSSTGMRGRRVSGLVDEGRGNGKQREISLCHSTARSDLVVGAEDFERGIRGISSLKISDRSDSAVPPFPTPFSGPRTDSRFTTTPSYQTSADHLTYDIALPHAEVPSEEFFKHIPADIPEPRRMKILLGWCGERALPPKPEAPVDNTPESRLEFQAQQAARIIQEEISKDLFTNGALSDWFSRDESVPAVPLKKKPNPRNVINAAKAEELERELERLEQERAEWEQLSKAAASPTEATGKDGKLSPVQSDLLDSPQRSILEQLRSSTDDGLADPKTIQQRLSGIAEGLEFTVDQFTHGVHTLATTKQTADRLADKTLSEAATIMEERDQSRPKTVDGMNSLKALGKLLNSRMR